MSDLRALVLGAGGQLGRACMESVPEQVTAQGLTRSECDITDAAALKQTMGDLLPQVVINAAAYTAVDQAEEDIDAARAVNADAPALIADLCATQRASHTSLYRFCVRRKRPQALFARCSTLTVGGLWPDKVAGRGGCPAARCS